MRTASLKPEIISLLLQKKPLQIFLEEFFVALFLFTGTVKSLMLKQHIIPIKIIINQYDSSISIRLTVKPLLTQLHYRYIVSTSLLIGAALTNIPVASGKNELLHFYQKCGYTTIDTAMLYRATAYFILQKCKKCIIYNNCDLYKNTPVLMINILIIYCFSLFGH